MRTQHIADAQAKLHADVQADAQRTDAGEQTIISKISRREFLGSSAAAGGLALSVGWAQAQTDAPKYGADGMPNGWVDNPQVFVSIARNGTVTIMCHRAEMGQGVRTGVPMIVADELEADWSRVKVAQAPGDEVRYGNQDTDGSRTTRHFFMPKRRCGAAARTMLEAAAAARWAVPAAEVMARNPRLIHTPSGKSLGFGDVAADAAKLPVPKADQLRLKTPAEFRYIGKGKIPIVDGFDMSTGRAVYGQDVVLPDMLFAVVARSGVLAFSAVNHRRWNRGVRPGVVGAQMAA